MPLPFGTLQDGACFEGHNCICRKVPLGTQRSSTEISIHYNVERIDEMGKVIGVSYLPSGYLVEPLYVVFTELEYGRNW